MTEFRENGCHLIENGQRIANRISGLHPSSLGLHPVVYFYSSTGRYQPTAFLATVEMVKDLERQNAFKEFASVRQAFESFLLKHKVFINQVVVKFGSGLKGLGRLHGLLTFVVNGLVKGLTEPQILEALSNDSLFTFLQPSELDEPGRRKDFDSETKSAAFLRDALKEPLRCKICNGLVHYNSISIDHIVRREDGGLGTVANAQLTHPYCNSTLKN